MNSQNNCSQKFFLYCRKSTDVEDKQVLSIEAQLTELREFAKRESLVVIEEFIEKQTAKIPGRPIFDSMIERIEKGEASGILAWHPDRLARNSVDGGRIIYLLDTGKLQSLKFPTHWFENTPQGKFVLQIAFGQSKYYVDNLSENVKRGNRQKLRRGEWPNWAPPGYKNDKNTRSIVVDPEKPPLVKKLFEEYSTGKYTLREMEKLCLNWRLFSRNNKPLHISSIQRILRNSFYIELMKYNGEVFEGKHKPIISKKLFESVQKVIASKSKKIEFGKYHFVFRDLGMRCGECGLSITAEKHIKKSGREFSYYRCTKKIGFVISHILRKKS